MSSINHTPKSIEDKLTRLRDIFNDQVIENNMDKDKIKDKIKDKNKIISSMKTIIDIYKKYNSHQNTKKSRLNNFAKGVRRTAKGVKHGLGAAARTMGHAVSSGILVN
jgi:hypothetical protein